MAMTEVLTAPRSPWQVQDLRHVLITLILLLRFLIRFLYRFLLCAGAAENAPHPVISFMAGVLEDRSWSSGQRNLHGPGLCESLRVVHRELVQKRVRIQSPEAL